MRGSGSKRRPHQVAEVVRQVLAEAIAREVRDPRIGLVTITRIDVSGDLSHANVFVMAQGDEPAKISALEGLQSAAGFLRGKIAKALSTRTIPQLHFVLDRGLEHAARIHEVLADLKRESGD